MGSLFIRIARMVSKPRTKIMKNVILRIYDFNTKVALQFTQEISLKINQSTTWNESAMNLYGILPVWFWDLPVFSVLISVALSLNDKFAHYIRDINVWLVILVILTSYTRGKNWNLTKFYWFWTTQISRSVLAEWLPQKKTIICIRAISSPILPPTWIVKNKDKRC